MKTSISVGGDSRGERRRQNLQIGGFDELRLLASLAPRHVELHVEAGEMSLHDHALAAGIAVPANARSRPDADPRPDPMLEDRFSRGRPRGEEARQAGRVIETVTVRAAGPREHRP